MSEDIDLWVEKYKPKTLNEYVFKNKDMKETIVEWVSNTENKKISIPNILLWGPPGTGKSSASNMICNLLNVHKSDILTINASRENNVDTVREKIVNFCSTWPHGDYKIVQLEESDGLGLAAQKILRSEIERFYDSVRFILTANYENRIIPALHSRLQSFHITELDMENFIERLFYILEEEQVKFNEDDLTAFVDVSYPDLRKAINLLDQHTVKKVLKPLMETTSTSFEYMEEAMELFKNKKFKEARKLVCSNVKDGEYESIYRYFYTNLHLFATDELGQSQAIIDISQGLVDHTIIADPEINLAATMARLARIE